MAAASLELSGISKRYPGVQALNGVDFACRPGEIHAVLGEIVGRLVGELANCAENSLSLQFGERHNVARFFRSDSICRG